jgi:uncharacterized phage-like protein YoqJ
MVLTDIRYICKIRLGDDQMKVAIIGSRTVRVTALENYIPEDVTEILSGGAVGVDTCAKEYAQTHQIKLTEYLPDYRRYGRGAPLKRNLTILQNADLVLAFWDGKSRGTKYVIENARKLGVPIQIIHCPSE